jgi:hypothetical protein
MVVFGLAVSSGRSAGLAAGGFGGVYLSGDRGASWSLSSTGLDNASIVSFAIDPTTPTTVYAGSAPVSFGFGITIGGGVFRTTDGAGSWTSLGLTGYTVSAIVIDPVSPASLYAATSVGIFRSADAGATWTTALNALTGRFVSALIASGSTLNLCAETSDGGLFRSSDGGVTWIAADPPLPISSVQALAFDPRSSAVFAGTDQGVFRSTDGGATWSAVNTGLTTLYVQTLALDSAREILYAGTYGGSVFALALTVSPGRVPVRALPQR